MKLKHCWVLLLLFVVIAESRRRFSEEDQAKYLQDLKEKELRDFEQEMKQQSAMRGAKYSSSEFGVQLDDGNSESMALPSELRGPSSPKKKHRHHNNYQTQAEALKSSPPVSEVAVSNFNVPDDLDDEDHWCYHCASPMDKLRPEMRKSIRNLLEMRRTAFPKDAVTPECSSARNLTKLKKQKCSYKYCQTLSILDRNAGNAFVVRGCAEYFGAINVPELEKNDDFSCRLIHEKLEIKECICKTNKYCNAGWGKRSIGSANQQSFAWTVLIAIVVYLY